MLGTPEIVLIVLVIILLFGANKVPELARSFGKATGEFKKGQNELENELFNVNRSTNNVNSEQNISVKIRDLANDLGISIDGKTDDQLLEEIRKKKITIEKKK